MLRSLNVCILSLLAPLLLHAQEICDNALDDDGDGLIDLNDPDCPCSTVLMTEGLPSLIRNHSFEEQMCCPFGFSLPGTSTWLSCATGWHQATVATTDYLHTCGFAPAGTPMPPPDGQGAVAFQVVQGMPWFEYVGTCLTYPPPANILLAGTTYTLSLWIAGAASDNQIAQTTEEGRIMFYSTNPVVRWDGTQEGEPVMNGVYQYKYIAKGLKMPLRQGFGHVTLIR